MIKTKRARKSNLSRDVAPSPSDQGAAFIQEKIAQARRLADIYAEGESKLDNDIYSIMQCAMELHDKFVFYGDLAEPLIQAFKRDKIRVTKNTTSNFIPLMKLVAPGLSSSTRGRSASILAYADENSVSADSIGDFVRHNGGIVTCHKAAKKAVHDLKKPIKDQRRAEKDDTKLLALRENGRAFTAPALKDGLTEGVWCCLIEKKGDHLSLLSVIPGSPGNNFKPLGDIDFVSKRKQKAVLE